MSNYVTQSDKDRFEQDVLKSDRPVAVSFYTDECPPCDALNPLFERMAVKVGDRMKFVRVYRQQNRELSQSLGVKSSPTVLFYKNGEEVCRRLTGYITTSEFREAIENVIEDKCTKKDRQRYDCDALVLGAGPAGLTAAIYLARAKLRTVVLDESMPGGQAATTLHISNYPGTSGTVKGSDLMNNMAEQAMSFGALIDDFKEVQELDLRREIKVIKTEDTDYYAKAVIVCTGAEPRRLPAEGEREYRGRGVHYCAACDGALYQDRKLVVVGGGNSAVEEAVFLTRFASHVTVVHQLDHFQASKVAQDELFRTYAIDVIWDTQVKAVSGDAMVKEVELVNLKTREVQTVPADGVFVYIGMQPRTDFLRGQVALDESGYIVTDESLRTNVDGVYAAGDVRQKLVRQVATAVGDGAVAGLSAEKYIAEKSAQLLGVN